MIRSHDAYLVGYYGKRNSGDDALMYATAWGAHNLLHCKTTRIATPLAHHSATIGNVKRTLRSPQFFRGQERLQHYRHAMASKRIIFGGGAVLHTERDIALKLHMMRLSNARKSLALGVTLGPFESLAAEKACARFLNTCGFIGLRDATSFELAKSLAPEANAHLTFDLAPMLLCFEQVRVNEEPREGVAVNLCRVAVNALGDVDNVAEDRRVEKACGILRALWRETGQPITLVEMNGDPLLGDWQVHNRVLAELAGQVPLQVLKYDPDPTRMLKALSRFKLYIGMRLHGAILSYLAGTPVISLGYHAKNEGWCEQIGMPAHLRFDATHYLPSQVVNEALSGLETGFSVPALPVSHAVESALSNWSISHEKAQYFCRHSHVQQSCANPAHA